MKKENNRDSLGDRMKLYEATTRFTLPRRTHIIIRLDGRSFSSYTKKVKAEKPFDESLMWHMDMTAKFLCSEISGAQMAYVQSDEINILITDFDKVDTQQWFGGVVQKMASVSASMATAYFNAYSPYITDVYTALNPLALGTFDSRVFTIPDATEVYNLFLWRLRDWERNSLSMFARSFYSTKELHGKKSADMHEMLHKKDKNWADLPNQIKRGRLIKRNEAGVWESVAMFALPHQKAEFQKLIPAPGYE